MDLKVLVVAEYYPRTGDPVSGIWAHRQTVAAREAGAEMRVVVLHRPLPPLGALRSGNFGAALSALRQPRSADLDGIPADYLRYLSPPRPWSYESWGAWAAIPLARALRRLRARWPFELIHAHYAVPAGDAVRRAAPDVPLVVSVHGHDVYGPRAGGPNVARTLKRAELVLANSTGTARRCEQLSARGVRVLHLGAEVPSGPSPRPHAPVLVTVGHLVARKRHADVIRAVALLRERHPQLRYVIVGDGPERTPLRTLASSLEVAEMVELRGRLEPHQAVSAAQEATLFVLPSVEEAFGVAYVEAMAGGVPAIGCRGQDGPEEIAAAGGGITLVPARDPGALAAQLDELLQHPETLAELGNQARATVEREFSWRRCGDDTVAAYRAVLASRPPA